MKIAKTLLMIMLVLCGCYGYAQGTPKCEESFKVFEQAVTAGKYDEATAMMADLRKKCAKYSDKLYTYGETVLKYKIEVSATPADKQALVAELLSLYSDYALNFPKSDAAVKKAMLQAEHKLADFKEVYKALDAAFTANREAFTDYNALEAYFELALKHYESVKTLSQEQLIEKYGAISAQTAYAKDKIAREKDALVKKQETEKLTPAESQWLATSDNTMEALDAVSENMAMQASRLFDCAKLEAYYDKNYEAHKADLPWLQGLATSMYGSRCFSSAVLYKAAQALNAAKPTAASAYMLGNIELKRRNQKQALAYFDQSAMLETSPSKKASQFYEIASIFRNSDKAKAKEYVLKAIEQNKAFGKPYLLLAEMYTAAGRECGLGEFERKALLWLAIETAQKAQAAEPRYKTTVASLVKNYSEGLPNAKEAKAAGKKKGDTITYGCWINETVTLPNL